MPLRTLMLTILVIIQTNVFAIDNPWEVKLPLKSGLITYSSTGSMKGQKTLYFKDHGQTTAEYQRLTLKVMGMTSNESTIRITAPDWIYTIDNLTKHGVKEPNPKKYLIAEFNTLSESEKETVAANIKNSGKLNIEGFQGEISHNAVKILGYDCDIISILGTKVYLISGTDIPLRTIGSTMGIEINEIATSIKPGTPPEKVFTLPTVKYETEPDAESRVQRKAKAIIQSLLHNQDAAGSLPGTEDFIKPNTTVLPFNQEVTAEEALRFREQQGYNDLKTTEEGDHTNQEEAAHEIQQSLKKMLKDVF